ncbi:MAG: small multi-drug export protein [Oscillospiraceae bacterium]
MSLLETLQQTELGKVIATFFISMMPILELRGAIPMGVTMGLGHWQSMVISVVGNMVPVPFIIIFIRKIFTWLQSKSPKLEHMVTSLEAKAEGKWDKVRKYELLGLTILVAIPLPGTGAWTGALIAALMDIRMKSAIPCIFLGVVIAGFLITGLTFGFTAIFS